MLISTIIFVEIEVVRKFITYQTITANILRRIIANYPNQQVRISQLKLKSTIIDIFYPLRQRALELFSINIAKRLTVFEYLQRLVKPNLAYFESKCLIKNYYRIYLTKTPSNCIERLLQSPLAVD